MKLIKVAFDDCWSGFDVENEFIIKALQKRYQIEIVDTSKISMNDLSEVELDYLFYSSFGERHVFYNCIKIFFSGECVTPDFNECDYALGFDYLSFGDRYLRYPLHNNFYHYRKMAEPMMQKNETIELQGKKFCSMVVSNVTCANPLREKFFVELSKYKKVDSGGRALNNIGEPNGVKDKLEFQKQYKFSLAFENASAPGYCTEKIIEAYAAGTVPIYWGDPMVINTFNPKSFVWVDENHIDDAIRTIIELDCDDEKYLKMRSEPAIIRKEEEPEQYDLRYETWLYHIIDQDKEQAYRIGKYGWHFNNTMDKRKRILLMDRYQNRKNCFGSILSKIKLHLRRLKNAF